MDKGGGQRNPNLFTLSCSLVYIDTAVMAPRDKSPSFYSKSPMYEQVPFRERVRKSNL